MKKLLGFLFHRLVLVAFAIIVQLAFLMVMLLKFQNQFVYFYGVSAVLSVIVVLFIINGRSNPAYKLAWVVPILLFPIFGGIFYLLFGSNRPSKHEIKKMSAMLENYKQYLPAEKTEALMELEQNDMAGASQSRYISKYAQAALYKHTTVDYLPSGECKFEQLLVELRAAEHFIFMEYFIIQPGKMWDSILEVLVEKAAQGVDVRVMYDDVGCIMTLPYGYDKKLMAMGIKCGRFNPFVPILSTRLNNRDHRKICIIDGHTGFTGGINLADEYINAIEKHGHWKDTAVLLRGEAVWNLTLMFLSMWNYLHGQNEDYAIYRPDVYRPLPEQGDGYVQPFADNPLDGECVGETVYLNMINKAERYIYITTPYLIIDNEMVVALQTAAKNGVDVRIITPHVADKWYVHAVTRAYYEILVESGVRIYEYTPGFIHAKTYVCDDRYAVVGTINMDYRSLYLHFECGAWICGGRGVQEVREDFDKTLDVCQEITLEQCRSISWGRRLGRGLLKSFAPLM
ncbi:MAG: cardiolipin synthase [Angelakisella sp.]